jgi:hypothetical protein
MQCKLPPDLERLVNKRLAGGRYAKCRRCIPSCARSWTDEERHALASHVEEGCAQAERGKLTDGTQARRGIQILKDNWLRDRSPKK